MSIVVSNTGLRDLTWGGTAEAVVFRDARGRMVGAEQLAPGTRRISWAAGAATAEIRGPVWELAPELATAETAVAIAVGPLFPPAPRRETTVRRVTGRMRAAAVVHAVAWSIFNLPVSGVSLTAATYIARGWLQRGRETLMRLAVG